MSISAAAPTLSAALNDVQARSGALSEAELPLVYGCLAAYQATCEPVATGFPEWLVQQLAYVVSCLRHRPCPWCGTAIQEHLLEPGSDGEVVVLCADRQQPRPLEVWYVGPRPITSWHRWLGWGLWAGIPVLSLGMLAWLMPLVAGVRWRRRRWIAAALAFLPVFLAVGFGPPELAANGLVVAAFGVQLLVGPGYGGRQVKTWLAARQRG